MTFTECTEWKSHGKQLLEWSVVGISMLWRWAVQVSFTNAFPVSPDFTVTACRVTGRICVWEETSCTSNLNVTWSPVMALMDFSFLSLRIPSGKSFKLVLHSADILREAGNQVFSYNYCIKWNYQEVIKFLVTSLLTTMMQPLDHLGKRRIWMFCCSICMTLAGAHRPCIHHT